MTREVEAPVTVVVEREVELPVTVIVEATPDGPLYHAPNWICSDYPFMYTLSSFMVDWSEEVFEVGVSLTMNVSTTYRIQCYGILSDCCWPTMSGAMTIPSHRMMRNSHSESLMVPLIP